MRNNITFDQIQTGTRLLRYVTDLIVHDDQDTRHYNIFTQIFYKVRSLERGLL